jgi:two-component system OmpR family response regulator
MRFALQQAGHQVVEAADGAEGYKLFQEQAFDLAVLDIVMPEDDGLQLCRKIRKLSKLPIIFVSSRDDELDRVLGLELGGDDYITKPFSPRELSARVGAILRRARDFDEEDAGPESEPALSYGAIFLDPRRHLCRVADQTVVLTVTEFALLRALVESPGRVFSRAQLVEHAYGSGHYITDRTVDSHVRRIRKKLGAEAELVETVYGVGYRLRE